MTWQFQGWVTAAVALAVPGMGCSKHGEPSRTESTQQAAGQLSISAPFEVDLGLPTIRRSARYGITSAFNGATHVAVWLDQVGMLRASRFDPDGNALDPSGASLLPITFSTPRDCSPRDFVDTEMGIPGLAANGPDALAAWRDGDQVKTVIIHPDLSIGDPLTLGNATGSRVGVASHSNGYLVVWDTSGSIQAQRVSKTGAKVGPEITVSSGMGCPSWSAVTCLPSQCLAAWENYPNGANSQIFAARVDPSTGSVLDASSFRPDSVTDPQSDPVLANDGTGYLLGYYQRSSSNSNRMVKAVRVTTSGQGIDPQGITVGQAGWGPAVMAYGGGSYLFVWPDGDSNYLAARVANGTVQDVPPKSLSFAFGKAPRVEPSNYSNGLTFDGTNFALQLEAGTPVAARISPSFTVLDTPARALAVSKQSQLEPTVAFDGSNYLVGWSEFSMVRSEARVARIAPNGQRLDPSTLLVGVHNSPGEIQLKLSGNSSGFLSEISESYIKDNLYYYTVSTVPVTSGGTANPSTGVIVDNFRLRGLAASASSTNHLATWHETRRAGNNVKDPIGVMAMVISNSGTPISPAAIVQPGAISDRYWTSSAANGSSYLVAWSGVEAKRVSFTGTVLDTQAIQVATGSKPCVASNGQDFAIFSEASGGLQFTSVSAGGVVGGTTPLETAGLIDQYPSCAFDGGDYWVVWSNADDIYGWRVDPSGSLVDLAPIPLGDEPDSDTSPVLQAGPSSNLLLTYRHRDVTECANGFRIRARLIASGMDGGPPGIDSTPEISCVARGGGGSGGGGAGAGGGSDAVRLPAGGDAEVGGGCRLSSHTGLAAWWFMALMVILARVRRRAPDRGRSHSAAALNTRPLSPGM